MFHLWFTHSHSAIESLVLYRSLPLIIIPILPFSIPLPNPAHCMYIPLCSSIKELLIYMPTFSSMVCSYTLQALYFSAQFSLTICVLSQNECFFQGCCACVQKNVKSVLHIQAVNNADAWTEIAHYFAYTKESSAN